MKKQNKRKLSLSKIQVSQLDKLAQYRINGGTFLGKEESGPGCDEPDGTAQSSVGSKVICKPGCDQGSKDC